MTSKQRQILLGAPLAIVPVVFLSVAPWLKSAVGGTVTTWVAAAVSAFVMFYAWYVALSMQRRLDEVQRAGADYAAKWGVTAGQIAFFVLLALPPFQNLVG